MELTVSRANPEGNLTLLVEGPVLQSTYARIGEHLMRLPGLEAEQVGFVIPPKLGGIGRLEMMGGEFCGNAARSFGFWLACRMGIAQGTVSIEISGSDRALPVRVDHEAGTAFVEMPPPADIRTVPLAGVGPRPMVYFDGIRHLILEDVPADQALFNAILAQIYKTETPEALGVLFLNRDKLEMTPVVYVHAPGTICFEQSCGSGSTAVAAWLHAQTGQTRFSIRQPGGTLTVTIGRGKDGAAVLEMGGGVTLEEPRTLFLEER